MHQIQDDDPETDQRVSQERAMGRPDGYQIGVLPRSHASQAQVFSCVFDTRGRSISSRPFRLAYQRLRKRSLDAQGQYFFTAAS